MFLFSTSNNVLYCYSDSCLTGPFRFGLFWLRHFELWNRGTGLRHGWYAASGCSHRPLQGRQMSHAGRQTQTLHPSGRSWWMMLSTTRRYIWCILLCTWCVMRNTCNFPIQSKQRAIKRSILLLTQLCLQLNAKIVLSLNWPQRSIPSMCTMWKRCQLIIH